MSQELLRTDYNSHYVYIQNVKPTVDGGIYPIKRRQGDKVDVSAEILQQGHDGLSAELHFKHKTEKRWQSMPMTCMNAGLDLYVGSFTVEKMGLYEFKIFAYADFYDNWAHGVEKKFHVGEDVSSELIEGVALLKDCQSRANKTTSKQLATIIKELESEKDMSSKFYRMMEAELKDLAASLPDKDSFNTATSSVYAVRCDRRRAEFASWYEVFPRSCSGKEGVHGTFSDVEKMLPYIDDLGFDVLYFTPIHPIGFSKRKGKNNSLTAEAGEPGSPYAIGSEAGGHFAVHPELGNLDDFDKLVKACAERDIEIALDFALNCSPDHPYLKDHPDWFYRRPDGSIKYAENPPKKYEDIYPLNFECEDRKNLWAEIRDIFLFWASHGVRTFRVDNPHTKPISFWNWCIAEVHKEYEDVIFLSEAFTRPRLMELLAKNGFTQSYSYFTWRESKEELTEYFNYLHNSEAVEYMTANIFATTPDILPKHLQFSSAQMFRIRHALAVTLSPIYGMYTGYELCENIPVGPRDELMDSEKYELKVRDYEDAGSIAPFVKKLNMIRRENPALQIQNNLQFCNVNNEKLIAFLKRVEGNTLLVVISLDPLHTQSGMVHMPIHELGFDQHHQYKMHDLMTDQVYDWTGANNYVEISDRAAPVHVFRVF